MSSEYDQPTGPVLSRRKVLILAGSGAVGYLVLVNEAVKASRRVIASRASTESVNTDITSHQVDSIPSYRTTEQERINRLLALDILRQFVDISSNPFTEQLHKRVSEYPDEYVEIVDPLGAPGFYIPNTHSFFIYPEEKNRRGPNDFKDWSILIGVEDSMSETKDTVVSIQLNASGHVYRGPGDIVAPPGALSLTAKALQADYLFNIPDEMQLTDWYPQDLSQTSFQRQHIDSKGNLLIQTVDPTNVISLFASYPMR